jgi:hypothetical protein
MGAPAGDLAPKKGKRQERGDHDTASSVADLRFQWGERRELNPRHPGPQPSSRVDRRALQRHPRRSSCWMDEGFRLLTHSGGACVILAAPISLPHTRARIGCSDAPKQNQGLILGSSGKLQSAVLGSRVQSDGMPGPGRKPGTDGPAAIRPSPPARTGRLADAQFPGPAVYASPTGRTTRVSPCWPGIGQVIRSGTE